MRKRLHAPTAIIGMLKVKKVLPKKRVSKSCQTSDIPDPATSEFDNFNYISKAVVSRSLQAKNKEYTTVFREFAVKLHLLLTTFV